MSKIAGLQFVKEKLELHELGMTRQLLYEDNGEKTDYRIHFLGKVMLALAECKDHLYNLGMLREHCAHGVAGTVSEDFDAYDEDNPDVPCVYDAHREMAYYLSGEDSVSVLTLSPLLREFLNVLADSERRQVGIYAQAGWQLMTREAGDPTGPFRPMTADELAREADRDMLTAIEKLLFVESYEQDLARVLDLVEQHGDLTEALALIGPLPEPEPPLSAEEFEGIL